MFRGQFFIRRQRASCNVYKSIQSIQNSVRVSMRSKIMEGVRYYKFRSHDDGFGVKGWRFDPVGKSTPKEHTHHLNTFWVHWVVSHVSRGKLWTRWRNQKMKNEESTRGYNSPICPPHIQFAAATTFPIWGRTTDIIKHEKFQVNLFREFGTLGAKFTVLHSRCTALSIMLLSRDLPYATEYLYFRLRLLLPGRKPQRKQISRVWVSL